MIYLRMLRGVLGLGGHATKVETPILVLIHSPLVGPYTWVRVAEAWRQIGGIAIVPDVRAREAGGPPYWERHAEAVVDCVRDEVAADDPIVLVAHSGAGVLLPAVEERLPNLVSDLVFVDALVPSDGLSRFDLAADAASELRPLAVDGLLPACTADDLAPVIPDPATRRRFTDGVSPLPLAVYEEAIPVPASWPTARCHYLQLTRFYDDFARDAQQRGWNYWRLDRGHFAMLVDPEEIMAELTHFLLPGP